MIANSLHPPTPSINIGAAFAMDPYDSMLIRCIMGHVNDYPTMHYYENHRHTHSMIAYMTLTEYF